MRAFLLVVVVVVAGCGNASRYDAGDVERAFAANELRLHRVPSLGAEQPAMGETSPCATRYAAATADGTIVVSVCDDAEAAGSLAGDHVARQNVAVEYAGHDARTQARIAAALDDLD